MQQALEDIENSEERLQDIIDAIPTPAWRSLADGSKELFNKHWLDYTGLSPEEARGWGWVVAIHPEDLAAFTAGWTKFLKSGEPGEIEARFRRFDGQYRWFLVRAQPLRDGAGTILNWYGTSTDIDDRKRAESLLAAEKRTLEMMANGASLSEVLNDLCAAIDAHAPPVHSMVCLMDGEWLSPCAGPHVPATFKAAITPWRIGPDRASCGAAAFTKQRVIVPNISKDPRWPDDARDLTLSHCFSAAWSEPLISQDGEVLGTFAMYYPEPRTPQSGDFELITAAGHIALIAIELERSHRALKNALVEVKNSEDRLRTIIDTIPALAWSARPDGSAEFFNRRWLDYAGLSAEEALDWGWTVSLYPEDRGRLMDYWRYLLASEEAGEIEARLRRFDGEYRWFLFRASPLRNDSGRVEKWYGTNTDIEERKRAEEALRSNEQSLRRIVDTIPGLVCTMTATGEVQLLNRQVLEYFGNTTEELKNWASSDAVHPDDLPRVIDVWRRSVETGQPYEYELRQRRADGVYRWFQSLALPVRDSQGRITGWYMLLTDIDDRKRAASAPGIPFGSMKPGYQVRTHLARSHQVF
jgi:PAS domain S-box-containing protein